MKPFSAPMKITALYVLVGILWIFFSDKVLELFIAEVATLSRVQTLKGWIYIGVTAGLLFLMIKRDHDLMAGKDLEKKHIFGATVCAMEHILNNFLNQMLLFKLEAQKSRDFRPEILDLYDDVIGQTKAQIQKLGAIEELSEDTIKKAGSPVADHKNVNHQ